MKKILIIEPTWGNTVHFPFNHGTIHVLSIAYPEADLVFIGEREQGQMLFGEADNRTRKRLKIIAWPVYRDTDTLPGNVLTRAVRLARVALKDILTADLIVFTSGSGPAISALHLLPRSNRQRLQIFMHGDYSQLLGWKSRNAFRKSFDLYSSVRRAVSAGAKILVLEQYIKENARRDLPDLAHSFHYFPHPRVQSEVLQCGKKLGSPINIGLAGIASVDKGIKQLIELARVLNLGSDRGNFKFHAIGMKHASSQQEDFEGFESRPVSQQLNRREFLDLLDKLHFLFFWPTSAYYENASSGTLYDAVNRKIPIITSAKVAGMYPEVADFAIVGDTVAEIAQALERISPAKYHQLQTAILNFEKRFKAEDLAVRYAQIINYIPDDQHGAQK